MSSSRRTKLWDLHVEISAIPMTVFQRIWGITTQTTIWSMTSFGFENHESSAQKANVWRFSTQVGWVVEIPILPRHATLQTTNHPRWAFGSNSKRWQRVFVDPNERWNNCETSQKINLDCFLLLVFQKKWLVFFWQKSGQFGNLIIIKTKIKQILLIHGPCITDSQCHRNTALWQPRVTQAYGFSPRNYGEYIWRSYPPAKTNG